MAIPELLARQQLPPAPPQAGPVFPGLQGDDPLATAPGVVPPQAAPQPPATPIALEENVNGWQTFLKQVTEDPALAQSLLYLGAKLTDPNGGGGFGQIASGLNEAGALLTSLKAKQEAGIRSEEDRQLANEQTIAQTDLAVAQAEKARRPAAGAKPSDKELLVKSLVQQGLAESDDAARVLVEQGVTQTEEQFVLSGLKAAEVQAAFMGGLTAEAREAATRAFKATYASLKNVEAADIIAPVLPEANAANEAKLQTEFQAASKLMPSLRTFEEYMDLKRSGPDAVALLTEMGIIQP